MGQAYQIGVETHFKGIDYKRKENILKYVYPIQVDKCKIIIFDHLALCLHMGYQNDILACCGIVAKCFSWGGC